MCRSQLRRSSRAVDAPPGGSKLPPVGIFKANDIRGLVPEQLDADTAYRIGRATAKFIDNGPIVIGRDARTHSPELFAAVVRGIADAGIDAIDIGLVATPMLYFAVDRLEGGGVFMITASHNPVQYTGFKICR
jgi:phosphomannomutase